MSSSTNDDDNNNDNNDDHIPLISDDVVNRLASGTTGFQYLDSIEPVQRRAEAIRRALEFWRYDLTEEQRQDYMNTYYQAIREERRRADPLLMHEGISDTEIMRAILNRKDFEQVNQAAIEEAERNGRMDIADALRKYPSPLDPLHIELIEEEEEEEE